MVESDGKDIILRAISEGKAVRILYSGEMRTIEPYCLGTAATTGNTLLRAYQLSGGSVSGKGQGWRLFDMAKVVAVIATTEEAQPIRADYNPNDSALADIIAKR